MKTDFLHYVCTLKNLLLIDSNMLVTFAAIIYAANFEIKF